ncbi:MAG: hypothetical protein WC783_00690 [Candidatus Paceibacterota bacterium]|jgi:hypothetical protein
MQRSSQSHLGFNYDAIASGQIPGKTVWSKVGYNSNVLDLSDLWTYGNGYTPPSAAMGMEVVSDSADDDSAGDGARTVKIYYLTDAFVEKTETVTMDGTNVVATSAVDIYRINNFVVASVGVDGCNAGTIHLRHLTNTPIYSEIEPTYNKARCIFYTVPISKVLNITSITFGSTSHVENTTVKFMTRATFDNLSGTVLSSGFIMPYHELTTLDMSFAKDLELFTRFPTGVDLKVSAVSDTYASCSVALRGYLENV